jgi:Ca2+:H+ antiporter
LIGLWFSLRTHAALVYQTHHTRPQSIYQRLVPLNIIHNLLPQTPSFFYPHQQHNVNNPNSSDNPHQDNQNTISSSILPRPMSAPIPVGPSIHDSIENTFHLANVANSLQNPQVIRHVYEPEEEEGVSGHDSPNWSKLKSGIVLLSCTAFYSFIAGKV